MFCMACLHAHHRCTDAMVQAGSTLVQSSQHSKQKYGLLVQTEVTIRSYCMSCS